MPLVTNMSWPKCQKQSDELNECKYYGAEADACDRCKRKKRKPLCGQ